MGGCLKVIGIICLIAAIGIGILGTIITCGNDKRKEEKTAWINSYNEAIKEKDFEKAHNILEDIYTEYKVGDRSAEFTLDAYSEVYGAEFRYLILSGDEAAKDKISYMFTEIPELGKKVNADTLKHWNGNYAAYVKCVNGLCNKIIDIAINMDRYDFTPIALGHYLDNIVETDSSGIYVYKPKDKEAAQAKLDKAIEDGKMEKSE